MTYVSSSDILKSANDLRTALDEVERKVTYFQTDLDTNNYMKEALDWDYIDVRKSLDTLTHQVDELVYDAEQAYDEED